MDYYKARTHLMKDMQRLFSAAIATEQPIPTSAWADFKIDAARRYGFGAKSIRKCLEDGFGLTENKDGQLVKIGEAT